MGFLTPKKSHYNFGPKLTQGPGTLKWVILGPPFLGVLAVLNIQTTVDDVFQEKCKKGPKRGPKMTQNGSFLTPF